MTYRIKILYISLACLFLFRASHVFAQINEGGLPPSFQYEQQLRSAIEKTEVEADIYIEDLRETDNWRAREGVPMPVSEIIAVDYNIEKSGTWTTFQGGEKVWRMHLRVADAVALMLYYKDFHIPKGGKLFIYNPDKSQVLGAYTHRTNPRGGLFATEFIGGDELILEYVSSKINDEKPRIHINEIGYGYNTSALREFCAVELRSSGSCMVNINCEEGNAWQREKKSVCHSVQKIGRKSYICTGSLVNNTAEDFKPLILTARHCAFDGSYIADSADMAQWVFYFNKEREECSNSSLSAVTKTMSGCKLLAKTEIQGQSDGMLLLLDQMVPEDYDVFYNGWDTRDIPASSGVCLHHPSGDYMKISTYDTPLTEVTFHSTEYTGGNKAYWNVVFKETENGHSVTADGSSGSPLYNEKKLVVGTLTGGNSSCTYLKGQNLYGKMSHHWDQYDTDNITRMDIWLDPIGSGVETFQGRFRTVSRPSPTNFKAVNQGQGIFLTWEAPEGDEVPVKYTVYRNNEKVAETASFSFLDTEPFTGSLVYTVTAVYADAEESSPAMTTVSYLKYKEPTGLKAELNTEQHILNLSWNAPFYEQTIYWGALNYAYKVGFENNPPFYFGQKWSVEEIAPLKEKQLTAIQFIPIDGNRYEVYLSQGEHSYKQEIPLGSLKEMELNTIELEKPFVIDGEKSLIVAVYVFHAGTDFPAVCDEGPAFDGKGNIYSSDGKNWQALYDPKRPNKHDYNFIVSAVLNSEDGILPRNMKAENEENLTRTFALTEAPRAEKMNRVKGRSISLRSSLPVVFPKVEKYQIYRSGSVYKSVEAPETTLSIKNPLSPHYYEVTALYEGGVESERSNKAKEQIVSTGYIEPVVDISPTKFSSYVSVKGYEQVGRIEVISTMGKTCLVVNRPGEIIDTSSLLPGVCFFRLHLDNGTVKIIKAVK